ncbi:MAG: cyanophycinase [Chloroflexi bacterium]|nr:cyanophycinase [Chloroflexota bacterium]
MSRRGKGELVVIGGHEEKEIERKCTVLEYVARKAQRRNGRLALVTAATQLPREVAAEYVSVFESLGVRHVDVVDVRTRADGYEEELVQRIAVASVTFFTGGDQLRITSVIGDTPVFQCLRDRHRAGATIAGTSAGAAAMPSTMLIGGASDESNHVRSLDMAPGLGFLPGTVVDSHFAERGRLGRLLGAVVQNPATLGLGIDENTAIVVFGEEGFEVIGSGAVYVVDGSSVSYSSLSEHQPTGVVTMHGIKLHVLGEHDRFDLSTRRPAYAADTKFTAA